MSGPVIRCAVPQDRFYVCGGAATAGALNACREHLAEDLAPTLGWRDVLFGHFRDKLGLVVEDDNGDPKLRRAPFLPPTGLLDQPLSP